jgi:hypothetical protein
MSRFISPTVSAPPPAPPPPSPNSQDPAVAAATARKMDAAAAEERKARGRASTLMTGGEGVTDAPAPVSKRMLLGS